MRRLTRLAMVVVGLTGLLPDSTLHGAQGPAEEKPAKESAKQARKPEHMAVMRALVPARRVGPDDLGERLGEKDPQILHGMQMMRPFVRSEYHIVVRVCEPSDEQRRKLAESFAESVRGSAKQWLERMRQPNGVAWNEPERIIPEIVAEAIKPILTAEQWERYQADIEERKAQYRETAALSLVAVLDQEMRLSAEQRNQIRESLRANWDEKWVSSLEVFDFGPRFFPGIPDKYVEPYLDEVQKTIWRSIEKGQRIGFGLSTTVDNQALEDALRKTGQTDPGSRTQPD